MKNIMKMLKEYFLMFMSLFMKKYQIMLYFTKKIQKMFCENYNLDLNHLEMKLDFDEHFVNSSYENMYTKRNTSYSIYNLMLYIYHIVCEKKSILK